MNTSASLAHNFYDYTKERFPLPVLVPFSLAMFYLSYLFPNALSQSAPFQTMDSLLGWVVVLLVLLHVRIMDEHKDYERDRDVYPDRMLSKGLITLPDLRKIFYFIVLVQLAASIYLGVGQLILWTAIFAYTLLMLKEFFVPEFLNARTGLYLVTHQLSAPLIFLYGLMLRLDVTGIPAGEWPMIAVFLIGSTMAMMNYEISRKTWSADREHEHADSYTRVWGIKKTIVINQLAAISGWAAFVYFYSASAAGMTHTVILTIFYLLFLAVEIIFAANPTSSNSKWVEKTGSLYTLMIFVNSLVFFYRL